MRAFGPVEVAGAGRAARLRSDEAVRPLLDPDSHPAPHRMPLPGSGKRDC